MGMEIVQYDTGRAALAHDGDSAKDLLVGGPATATAAAPRFTVPRVAKVPLAAANAVLSWQNDEGRDIWIESLVIDVTTVATGACTLDGGTATASSSTSSDNLIDGLDVNAATGAFSNTTAPGSNGKNGQRLAAGKWVTITKASGTITGIVGSAYIRYHVL